MRVTHRMITDTMLRSLTQNVSRLEQLQEQITSGQRVNRPSQDPITAAAVLKIDSSVAQAAQHVRNADDARSWLDITDQALNTIGQSVLRGRELALAAPNTTMSSEGRVAIAKELTGLIDQVIVTGNFSFADQYIFSGTKTRTPPLDSSVSPPVYQGDSNSIKRIIDVGVTMQVNVTADVAILPTINALLRIRDAVNANDNVEVRAGLEDLDLAHTALLTAQSEIGARANRLDAQRERLLDIQTNLARLRSEQQDVDMGEAIANFSVQEIVYRAALQAGAKAIQPSLIDYLR